VSLDLEGLVAARYPSPEWAVVRELRAGVGYSRGVDRRIDVVAFNCWPSKGWHRLAFEVKRTRQDFKREIENPKKRKWVEENFHQTYFVTPHGLVQKDEIPESWGLMTATKAGDKLRVTKVATHREIGPLPETVALSAIRSLADIIGADRARHYSFESEDITQEMLDAKVEERVRSIDKTYETALDHIRKAKMDLDNARSRIEVPLSILCRMARDNGWFGSYGDSVDKPITQEVVVGWVDHIRHDAVRSVMRSVFETHEKLGKLIEVSKEAGLDYGEPSVMQKRIRGRVDADPWG